MDAENLPVVANNPSSLTASSPKTLSKAKIASIIKIFTYPKKDDGRGFKSESDISVSPSENSASVCQTTPYQNVANASSGVQVDIIAAHLASGIANPMSVDGQNRELVRKRGKGKEFFRKMAILLKIKRPVTRPQV